MDKDKAISFESALEKLEKAADNLKNDSLTLDDALKNYEEGIAYYKKCEEILQQAKQKIETYSK
jgi:exodeoxyribonuclease VII small subunit